ncbi:uncharacterized protein LOC122956064 [Acropora millepora]|uniref:uncharacterized protein LOC122956064 n=1 Tax=Acropora millepora TaxID=45264 RepID=UPI001CF1BBAC|nr:uncharacterized protein LOC122956064 [Acropora millepora]
MYMKQVVCCSFEQHSSHPCLYFQVSFKGNQPTDVQSELETTFNAKFNESGRDLKTTGSKRKLEQQVYQKEKDNENKEEERGEKSKNMISSKEQETRVDSKKRRKKEKRSGSQRKKVKETLK